MLKIKYNITCGEWKLGLNVEKFQNIIPRLEVEDEEMIGNDDDGMSKGKDNETEGEYKVNQRGDIEN